MIVEFRGLQKREWRVEPRKAGRLTLSSAASAGDVYALPDEAYNWWPARTNALWHFIAARLGSFSFTRTHGLASAAGGEAIASNALRDECAALPVGLPAANAGSGDFVPVVHFFSLANALFWLTGALHFAAAPSALIGSTPTAAVASVKAYGLVLLACLLVHGAARRLIEWLLARFTSDAEALHLTTNGALLEDRLKFFLQLPDIIGQAFSACVLLATGLRLDLRSRSLAMVLLYARCTLRSRARTALLQHLSVAADRRGASPRADGFGTSLTDVDWKVARAERAVLSTLPLLAFLLNLRAPQWALTVLAGAAQLLQLWASRRAAAAVVFSELNPVRMELCLAVFYAAGTPTPAAATTAGCTISPRVVSQWESPWTLPACFGPMYVNSGSQLQRLLHTVWTRCASLKVHIRFGAALSCVLENRVGVSARAKQETVQRVSDCLQTQGVALVFDEARFVYYVLLPEVYSCDGHPTSWAPLRTAAAAATHRGTGSSNRNSSGSLHEEEEGDDLEMGSRSRAVPTEGAPWAPLHRRLLWAYFYAYSHQRAAGFIGTTATPPPVPLPPRQPQPRLTTSATAAAVAPAATVAPAETSAGTVAARNGVIQRTPSVMGSPLHVIDALRADGVLDERDDNTPTATPPEGAERDSKDRDGLRPIYERFIDVLERQGWNLDRFLAAQEGYTVSVMYL